MRILHLFLIILLIAVVGAVACAWFDIVPVPVLTDVAYNMKGYGEAKTPDEALERFNKALEARNYKMASRYLDGDFQVAFRKQAKVAEKLAKAIDNFRHACKDRSLNSDRVEAILLVLEPLPSRVSVPETPKESAGGDKAVARITAEKSARIGGKAGLLITLKKVEGAWKIELPLDAAWRALFDDLDHNGQAYVNALDVVKERMKAGATTEETVFTDLRDEVKKVKQP